MPDLTAKERAFLDNLFLPGSMCNATESARRAGYSSPGKQAYEILRRPRIQAEYRRMRDEHSARLRASLGLRPPRKT